MKGGWEGEGRVEGRGRGGSGGGENNKQRTNLYSFGHPSYILARKWVGEWEGEWVAEWVGQWEECMLDLLLKIN